MAKVQAQDEHGRQTALDRYEQPGPKSEHGHMEMGRNLAHKYDSDIPTEKKGHRDA
jgi:hypothetical protein